MSNRVTFTSDSADRIAKVVRIVEAGNRDTGALPTSPRLGGGGGGKLFRMATFTGAWSINSDKTVTFANQTATPNTASVVNSLIALPDAGTRRCAIAKEGTAWYLVNWQWSLVTATAVENVTLSSSALVFARKSLTVFATADASSATISVSSCVTSQASATQLSFFS